jgi:hypothetical protein
LNWDSFKWRNHQPDIGRFFNVDPLADKYVYNSPYAFSENHVTSHIELEGLEKVDFMVAIYEQNKSGPGKNDNPKHVISNTAEVYLNFGVDLKDGSVKPGSSGDVSSGLKMAWQRVTEGEDAVGKLEYELGTNGSTSENGDSKYSITGSLGEGGEYGSFKITATTTEKGISFETKMTGVDEDKAGVIKIAGAYGNCSCYGNEANWLADDVLNTKPADGKSTSSTSSVKYDYKKSNDQFDKTDIKRKEQIKIRNDR